MGQEEFHSIIFTHGPSTIMVREHRVENGREGNRMISVLGRGAELKRGGHPSRPPVCHPEPSLCLGCSTVEWDDLVCDPDAVVGVCVGFNGYCYY